MTATDTVVVDASVAVKWVVTTEALAAQAAALIVDSLNVGRVLTGPPHLRGEVANALYQRLRSQDAARHLTSNEADRALADFLAIPLTVLDPPGLYEAALAFAREHHLPSLYDGFYVVLAQQLQAELWTADQRLLTSIGATAPWVRALAGYPLH